MHIQCDVAQCVGGCFEDVCPGDVLTASSIKGGRPGNKVEDGSMPAATTVFVLDPADAPRMILFDILAIKILFCVNVVVFFLLSKNFVELTLCGLKKFELN